MTHCEACYDLGAECECDCHSKTPSTTSKPVEEQELRDQIDSLELEAKWNGYQYYLTTKSLDQISDLITKYVDKQVLEGRIEEYQLGLLTGAMPELIGKPMAEEHLAELKALQTNNKEKK